LLKNGLPVEKIKVEAKAFAIKYLEDLASGASTKNQPANMLGQMEGAIKVKTELGEEVPKEMKQALEAEHPSSTPNPEEVAAASVKPTPEHMESDNLVPTQTTLTI